MTASRRIASFRGVNIGSFCTTPRDGIGRNMHRKHPMEMALTGDMFSAEDAVRFGQLKPQRARQPLSQQG